MCSLKGFLAALFLALSIKAWAIFLAGYIIDGNSFVSISASDLVITSGADAGDVATNIGNALGDFVTTVPSADNFCYWAFCILGLGSCIIFTIHACCSIRVLGAIGMLVGCFAVACAGGVANPAGVAMYKCLDANDVLESKDGATQTIIEGSIKCLEDNGLGQTLQFTGATLFILFHTFMIVFLFWNAGIKRVTRVVPADPEK